jgi:hypothetical protein
MWGLYGDGMMENWYRVRAVSMEYLFMLVATIRTQAEDEKKEIVEIYVNKQEYFLSTLGTQP